MPVGGALGMHMDGGDRAGRTEQLDGTCLSGRSDNSDRRPGRSSTGCGILPLS